MAKDREADHDLLRHVGQNIRKARLNRGLTLEDIGAGCGVDAKTVSRWELGKNNFGVCTLIQLAWTLDLSPAELLEGL